LSGAGIAVVYKAKDTILGRSIALKFPSEELAQNDNALEGFGIRLNNLCSGRETFRLSEDFNHHFAADCKSPAYLHLSSQTMFCERCGGILRHGA
jgi:hypothetical protein